MRNDFERQRISSDAHEVPSPAQRKASSRLRRPTAPDEVAHHFGLAPDGSFWLDTVLIEAVAE